MNILTQKNLQGSYQMKPSSTMTQERNPLGKPSDLFDPSPFMHTEVAYYIRSAVSINHIIMLKEYVRMLQM